MYDCYTRKLSELLTTSMHELPLWFTEIQDHPLPISAAKRSFDIYTLQDLIQLRLHDTIIAVTRVQLAQGIHVPHIHQHSEAVFVIEEGNATLLPQDIPLIKGQKLHIAKNAPHGFDVAQHLIFISYQTPPIHDVETGKEDFQLWIP